MKLLSRNSFLINASEASSAFGWGYYTPQQYHNLLLDKKILDEKSFEKKRDAMFHPIARERMEEGKRYESTAVATFEKWTGLKTFPSRLYPHPTLSWLAATPDREIGTEGLLEVKVKTGDSPPYDLMDREFIKFYIQIQLQLQCTNRKWCYYMGYSNVEPCISHRFYRDDDAWNNVIRPRLEDLVKKINAGVPFLKKRTKRPSFDYKCAPFILNPEEQTSLDQDENLFVIPYTGC